MRQRFQRALRMLSPYFLAPGKAKVWLLLIVLTCLLFAQGVIFQYPTKLQGAMMDALREKKVLVFHSEIVHYACWMILYASVVAISSYSNDVFILLWRRWMTRSISDQYFRKNNYYKLNSIPSLDNPDQRIAQDVNLYTSGVTGIYTACALTPSVMVVSSMNIWKISHTLVFILWIASFIQLVIALKGFGKPLSRLNYQQLRYEATFRSGLVRIRENAEAIAFYGGESQEDTSINSKFQNVYTNQKKIVFVNGFGLFVFNHLLGNYPFMLCVLLLLPALLSAHITPGTFTNALSFSSQLGGTLTTFPYLIMSFASLSASTLRLEQLREAMDSGELDTALHPGPEIVQGDAISVTHLGIQTPNHAITLVQDLNFRVKQGESILIMGETGCGKSSLLRVIAGIWTSATGEVERPCESKLHFLPQKPYMPPGNLRTQLMYPDLSRQLSDEVIISALNSVGLPDLIEQWGGLDAIHEWATLLSPGQQQRIAFARALVSKPQYVILDEATSALDVPNERMLYSLLKQAGMTLISVAHRPTVAEFHDFTLQMKPGEWSIESTLKLEVQI